jgi:hypothetical protein
MSLISLATIYWCDVAKFSHRVPLPSNEGKLNIISWNGTITDANYLSMRAHIFPLHLDTLNWT